ncbi:MULTISPECIES: hypothetical protein [unclassified Pseudomonas]|uniref:hypothetical protein n=1 Tax=unclassified Pseudomonas TaxID=196821 RepID=UPI002449BFFF|nr:MULTISPECIES: hypothetical protein [unclassified Pseudomonas]MDH0302686.1 hypothetical protein [Pseudomonas sp. GD04091]MDH1983595.1 hypothetical protein [Pseudomonas sp. GD03689]
MISEGAEVPVRRWKIGPANTEAKAYEAFADYAEPRLEADPDPDRFQVRQGLPARSL